MDERYHPWSYAAENEDLVEDLWVTTLNRRSELLVPAAVCRHNTLHIHQSAASSHWSTGSGPSSSETLLKLSYLTVIMSRAGSPQRGDRLNMAAGRGGLTNLERNGTLWRVAAETWSCCDTLPWCCESSYLKLCGGQSNTPQASPFQLLSFFTFWKFTARTLTLSKQGLSIVSSNALI